MHPHGSADTKRLPHLKESWERERKRGENEREREGGKEGRKENEKGALVLMVNYLNSWTR